MSESKGEDVVVADNTKPEAAENSEISKTEKLCQRPASCDSEERKLNNSLADSKAESLDDGQFVEANSSFSDDTTEQNEDDKLAFKDAREKLDDEEIEENSQSAIVVDEKVEGAINLDCLPTNETAVNNTNTNETDSVNIQENLHETSPNNEDTTEKEVDPTKEIANSNNVQRDEYNNNNEVSDDDSQDDEGGDSVNDEEGENSVNDEDSGSTDEEEVLDDDEIKSSPAYIPKRGLFYMHDLRNGSSSGGAADDESGTGADVAGDKDRGEKSTGVTALRTRISRADRKWEHDLYDDRQQRPKSTKELVRRYGHNIRQENKETAAIKVKENDTEKSDEVDEEVEVRSSPERRRRPRFGIRRSVGSQKKPPSETKGGRQNGDTHKREQRSSKSNGSERRPNVGERRRPRQISDNKPSVVGTQSSVDSEDQGEVKNSAPIRNMPPRRQPLPQKRIGFRRTIFSSRFSNSNAQQTPPRRSAMSNGEQRRSGFSRGNRSVPHRDSPSRNTSGYDQGDESGSGVRNFTPRQKSNIRDRGYATNHYSDNTNSSSTQQQYPKRNGNETQQFQRTSNRGYGSNRPFSSNDQSTKPKNNNQTQRFNQQQSHNNSHPQQSRTNKNYQQHGNGFYGNNSDYAPQQQRHHHPSTSNHTHLRTNIPPPNLQQQHHSANDSSNSSNSYLTNFPPLNASYQQQSQNHRSQHHHKNQHQQESENYYQQQNRPHLRQPTDVVYFDPNQQQQQLRNTNRGSMAQPRERRRLHIAPPTQ